MTQCSFAGSKISILQQVQLRGRNEKTHKKLHLKKKLDLF